jgi:hypothetical protein
VSCVVAFADLTGAPAERAALAHAASVPPFDACRVTLTLDSPVGLAAVPLPRRAPAAASDADLVVAAYLQ